MDYWDTMLDLNERVKRIESKLDETLNLFRLALANVEIREVKEIE